MAETKEWIGAWSHQSSEAFRSNHRIKSFRAYLEDLRAAPYSLSRNAPQYIVDMMDYFKAEEVPFFGEAIKRFKLFDAPFGLGTDQPLMGQEEPVVEIYEVLRNLVMEGRADRIVHLHGPNGSAKTLILELLMRGIENYSHRPEGALYTFTWLFPKEETAAALGFGGASGQAEEPDRDGDSYAHIHADRLEARIPCDLGDSPLLIIPPPRRMELVRSLLEGASDDERRRFVATYHIQEGDLCPRCRLIYDALLEDYRGDVEAVLRHVQVRRLFLSRRYRHGALSISPQDTPDAGSRQITLDQSLSYLPRTLQHLNLIQLYGDLVDANNGMVEFADFLTRAPELNKYLLSATERGELALSAANVYLNLVLFATSNERHLDAFKQSPDFASFKGRTILVTVPYLLERAKEAQIYRPILQRIGRNKHVAPHVASLMALWAVLTRLHRPEAQNYPEDVRPLVEGLTPYEKALLYDGSLPSADGRYKPRQLRALKELRPNLRDEFRDTPVYEGRFGASPREIREILYNAAFQGQSGCLTPMAVFEEMKSFLKDKSLYLFLQLKVDEGYHDADAAVERVREEYLRTLDREVLAAMELVPETQYASLFERYFRHVRAALRGEKVFSQASNQWEEPNQSLMEQVEEYLGVSEDPQRFREDLLGQVAAWTLENPDEPLDLMELFAHHVAALAKGFSDKTSAQQEAIGRALLAIGTPDFQAVPQARRETARATLNRLITRFGYCPHCAPQAVAFLLEHKYGRGQA